jgi:hypothetical protein
MKTMEVQKSAEPTAERGMASAKAEIGVYYASYYPTLTLFIPILAMGGMVGWHLGD